MESEQLVYRCGMLQMLWEHNGAVEYCVKELFMISLAEAGPFSVAGMRARDRHKGQNRGVFKLFGDDAASGSFSIVQEA